MVSNSERPDWFELIVEHFLRIEDRLDELTIPFSQISADSEPTDQADGKNKRAPVLLKDWYSVRETSHILRLSQYMVRLRCREGRIIGQKRQTGRGKCLEWEVSAKEIRRYLNHGPLAPPD